MSAKVDHIEAFIKIVGHHVSLLPGSPRDSGHVRSQGFIAGSVRVAGSIGFPAFRNKLQILATPTKELPLCWTEDSSCGCWESDAPNSQLPPPFVSFEAFLLGMLESETAEQLGCFFCFVFLIIVTLFSEFPLFI